MGTQVAGGLAVGVEVLGSVLDNVLDSQQVCVAQLC